MRRKIVVKKLLVSLAAAVGVVAFIALASYVFGVQIPYNNVAAEAKSLGLPTTTDYPLLTIPEGQNAAATDAFDTTKNKLPPTLSDAPPSLAEMEKVVKDYDANAQLVEAATRLPSYQAVDSPPSFQNTPLRAWVIHFTYRFKVHMAHRQLALAGRDLNVISRIADYLGQAGNDPYDQFRTNDLVRESLSELVLKAEASPESVSIAKLVLASLKPSDFIRFYKVQTSKEIQDIGFDVDAWNNSLISRSDDKTVVHLPVGKLTAITDYLKMRIAGLRAMLDTSKSSANIDAALNAAHFSASEPDGFLQSGRQQMRYDHDNQYTGGYFERHVNDEINNRLAQLGIAILEYRRNNGKLPDSLDQLRTKIDLNDPW